MEEEVRTGMLGVYMDSKIGVRNSQGWFQLKFKRDFKKNFKVDFKTVQNSNLLRLTLMLALAVNNCLGTFTIGPLTGSTGMMWIP